MNCIQKVLMLGILLFCVTACSLPGSWKQGPALSLPHVVTEFDGVQLILSEEQSQLVLKLECVNTASYQKAEVSVDTTKSDSQTIISLDHIQCSDDGSVLAMNSLSLPNTLQTGDVIDINFELQFSDAAEQDAGAKDNNIYMLGTDGKLREGMGSVYK